MARILSFDSGIGEAVDVCRRGGILVMPTDTVYGVGVDPRSRKALRRLYRVKGRDSRKPIPLLLSDPAQLSRVAACVAPSIARLAARFFPGPLTLVVALSAEFPDELNGGRGTIGVRVPDHEGTRRLLAACGGMLAVTSANRSGEPPATTVDAACEMLGDRVDLYLDGGKTPGGVPSTVLDVTTIPAQILRDGAVSADALRPYLELRSA